MERAAALGDTPRRRCASCPGIGIASCPADRVPRPGRLRCTRPVRTTLRSLSSRSPRSRDTAGTRPASGARTWPAGPGEEHHPCLPGYPRGLRYDERSPRDRAPRLRRNPPPTGVPAPVRDTRGRSPNRLLRPPGTPGRRGPGPTPASPVRPAYRPAGRGASASDLRRSPRPRRDRRPAANRPAH